MKKGVWLLGLIAAAGLAIAAISHVQCQQPLREVSAADPRNAGISAWAHLKYGVLPGTLVFDLRGISPTNSMADVFRLLLQYAQTMQFSRFERVELAYRGQTRFVLEGDYFAQLGAEFGEQNPVYTMRTFTEHVYAPGGEAAFGTWTGGLLGVLGKQLEDFNEFHRRWYLNDLARERLPDN